MKKYLVALTVAMIVCLLGMTASAQEADMKTYKPAEEEQKAIMQECYEIMDEINPEGLESRTQIKIMTEVYKDAGWTVVQGNQEVDRSLDIDPAVLELAYSDIDEATPEMKEKILDAREAVMSHYSWQNDIEFPNSLGYQIDLEKKEITFDPLFSELFPGWNPPRPGSLGGEQSVPQSAPVESVIEGCAIARDVPGTFVYYDSKMYISKATGTA